MTMHAPAVVDAEAEIRWLEWQARGVASDRRTAATMRKGMLIVIAAAIAWVVIQVS